jgi:phospholipase C
MSRALASSVVRKALASLTTIAVTLATAAAPAFARDTAVGAKTQTPIKYVVVIFQENVSFDHYFATFPKAQNPQGEPPFEASPFTPTVNGLQNPVLLKHNPNLHNPFRLDPSQNYTCDQNHDYTPEQQAFDGGLMDRFVQFAGVGGSGCPDYGFGPALTMGYYDGNTVTALWNYAQNFAMSDNSYSSTFGPSTPGALNLVAGNTSPYDPTHVIGNISGDVDETAVIGDPDPFYDDCGSPEQLAVTGKNVGDLLNAKGVTWGWFQGGFRPTVAAQGNQPAVCGSKTARLDGTLESDYSAHHEPFQYFAQTANPHHLPATSVNMIGFTDQANHQYDLQDFWDAANAGNMPSVSFLKAKRSQDGHAGYSSPLDEQVFLVDTINKLQALPQWNNMAVIIAYDDSDGWYDHVQSPIVSQSSTQNDAHCGTGTPSTQGRCGYGPRQPFLVLSPFARLNFVDHQVTDQSSILRFIEDNWNLGRLGAGSFDAKAGSILQMFDFNQFSLGKLILEPSTGRVIANERAQAAR